MALSDQALPSQTLPDRADRRFLFVDINSFFTSCEQADNPSLQGKPVIVVPTRGSCALAASYEAKAYGVKTGTLEKEARFLCPDLHVVPARPKRYMEYHYQITEILEHLAPRVTMRSVDEGSIQLCRNEDPWQLGWAIKQALWQQLSPAINCSIGIAPNLFLAKLATELQKPNGLVEIRLEELPAIFDRIKLRDLCGINFKMERQLHQRGIYSVRDFYTKSPVLLRQYWGISGYRWWLQLHGYTTYEHCRSRQSLSHSHVLPPAYRDPAAAYVTLKRLVAKVGRRLRRDGYRAGRIALLIRFVDKTGFAGQLRITPANDSLTLNDHITQLWQTAKAYKPILKLAIWTSNLVDNSGMPWPLFKEEQQRLSLAMALDRINDRYGADTIRFAIVDRSGSRAPDRISFTALFKIEHQ